MDRGLDHDAISATVAQAVNPLRKGQSSARLMMEWSFFPAPLFCADHRSGLDETALEIKRAGTSYRRRRVPRDENCIQLTPILPRNDPVVFASVRPVLTVLRT